MLALLSLAVVAGAAVLLWPRDPRKVRDRAFSRGNGYVATKKYHEAIIEYRSAIKADPRFGEAHLKLADAYAEIDDARDAFYEYVLAAELLPARNDAQLKAGSALLLMGLSKQAGERADRVLARDPGNLDAKILRANAAAGMKNLDDAVTQMYAAAESVATRPGDEAKVLLHLGVMELARGHRNDAEGILRKATVIEPASVENHLALANYYWVLRRYDEAESELKHALAADPKEPRANRALASLYIITDRTPEAEGPLKVLAAAETEPATRFLLADYYLVGNRMAEASALLKTMLDDAATYADAQVRLALIEYQAGRAAAAGAIIDAALKKEPKHPRVLLMKARLLAEARRFDDAVGFANQALVADPKSAEAYYLLGSIHLTRNEPTEAITAFNQVLKLRPALVDVMLQLSALHLARHDTDTAVRFAEEAVLNAPRSTAAHLTLVHALLASGNITQSELELKPLLEANPKSAIVLTEWGRLLMLQHDPAGARRFFTDALAVSPDSIEALTELVGEEIASGRAADAKPGIDERLARAPGDARLLFLAARLDAATGDAAGEEKALVRVVALDPSNLPAYGALGQFYYAAGRLSDARRQFEQIAAERPTSVGAYTMLGMIEELQHEAAAAEKSYRRALAIDRTSAVAANNLACIYVRRGDDIDIALELAQTAKAMFPNEPEFNDTLGWIYVQKRLAGSALPPLLDSVRAMPNDASFRYHLGMAYVVKGDARMARLHLEKALALQGDFDGASDARQELARLPVEPPTTTARGAVSQ